MIWSSGEVRALCQTTTELGVTQPTAERYKIDTRISRYLSNEEENERTQISAHHRHRRLPGKESRRAHHPRNGQEFRGIYRLLCHLQRLEPTPDPGDFG